MTNSYGGKISGSSLSRGSKVRVMTKAQWVAHPDKAIVNGQPGLSDGIKPWINVQFNG